MTEPKTNSDNNPPAPAERPRPILPPNIAGLIGRHGTAEAALTHVASENFRHRRAKRELEEKVTSLESQLKDGIILKGDDKTAWEAFKALGKKPSEIEGVLKEHSTLAAEKAARDQMESVAPVAKDWGFNTEALLAHARDKGLALSVKDRTGAKDGEPKKEVVVKEAGEGKSERSLKEYADGLPAYLQAALTFKEEGKSTGQPFIRQPAPTNNNSGTGQGATRSLEEQLNSRYLSPSDLLSSQTNNK